MTTKLTRQDILDKLPEHLRGRVLHICGPDDDYDEEEDNEEVEEEIDPEFDQMQVPKKDLDKRAKLESSKPVEKS